MAWAAPLLALVLAWKDYAFPWFRELMPLANTGLLLAVVLAALSPAHRIVRLCAEGRTFVRLAMKGRSWLCLGMIATGGAALWLGRMTDDLVINGRSWLLAAGRPHLLLLLASITLHLLLVGRMLTARLLEKGGAHA